MDEGRRDLLPVLVPLLSAAVGGALGVARHEAGWSGGPVLVVPAPSSSRSMRVRGDTPLLDLAAAMVQAVGMTGTVVASPDPGTVLRLAPVLRPTRAVADQAGLDTQSRALNLRRAHTVTDRWDSVVRGRRCLLVDDVLTTGTTLTECARALREAGAGEIRAATMAIARRH